MADQYEFYATAAFGTEELLKQELKSWNIEPLPQKARGGVAFKGRLEDGYRMCLWSRVANRVLLKLATFNAQNPDELYRGVRKIHWSDHLSLNQTFAVEFTSGNSAFTHSHYATLKAKDAIVDQFQSIQGSRPSVRKIRPDVFIHLYANQETVSVAIDLSGESLHKRAYRSEGFAAPLKETLAASLVGLTGWNSQGENFLDPMCGSGSLPIEAGLKALNLAPGAKREYFGFQGWLGHVPKIWTRLLEEAKDLEYRGKIGKIVGYDQDFRAVRKALTHVEKAGLTGKVHIEKRDFAECEKIADTGVLLMNPPYGERVGEVTQLVSLYETIGSVFKHRFQDWTGFVFTGSRELAQAIHLKPSLRIPLFNGPIECRLLKYELYSHSRS